MTNFQWQTEEDHWDDVVNVPAPPPTRRRWPLVVTAVLLATAVIGWSLTYTQQWLGQTATQVRQDVASSYHMVLRAEQNGDRELLRALLSGRDNQWMREILEAPLFDRTFLGLTITTPPTLITETIQLNAPLDTAVVTTTQTYVNDLGTAVTLTHTAHFRRGQSRWLMAPPEADFWGEQATFGTVRFNATYPERDTAVVRRLLTDLDQLIEQLCQPPHDWDCANVAMPQRPIALHFDTTPASLTQLNHPLGALASLGDDPIRLPTPTLVGLPTDEASYRALVSGYAAHIIPVWTVVQLELDCCEGTLLIWAVLENVLAQIEARPSPLTPADIEYYANQPARIPFPTYLATRLAQRLQQTDTWWAEHQRDARLWAFYIAHTQPAPLAEILTTINRSPREWASQLYPQQNTDGHLRHLTGLLVAESIAHDSADTTPLLVNPPRQNLLMACQAQPAPEPQGHMWRYRSADQAWEMAQEWEMVQIQQLVSLPSQEGMLILESGMVYDSFAGLRTTRIQLSVPPAPPVVVYETAAPPDQQSLWQVFPFAQNSLILIEYPRPTAANPDVGTQYHLAPTADCLAKPEEAPCAIRRIAGPIVTSPSQNHHLVWYLDERTMSGPINLHNAQMNFVQELPPHTGWPLAWLNDNTYLYNQLLAVPETVDWRDAIYTIYTASLAGGEPTVLFDPRQINALMDEPTAEWAWHMGTVWTTHQEGLILIHLYQNTPSGPPRSGLVVYDWRAKQRLAMWQGGEVLLAEGWPVAVHGRWLVWQSYANQGTNLQVLDWQTGQIIYDGHVLGYDASNAIDWSADGEWLSILQPAYFTLLHLPTATSHRQRYPTAELGCYTAVWE